MATSTKNFETAGSKARKCLICREQGEKLILNEGLGLPSSRVNIQPQIYEMGLWNTRCIKSMCRLLKFYKGHPYVHFFLSGSYCQDCIQLMKEIDFTLNQLDNFQKQIIGFRQDVLAKLEENYGAIPIVRKTNASLKDAEPLAAKKKLSYDEVVKIIYKRVQKEFDEWEEQDIISLLGNTRLKQFIRDLESERKVEQIKLKRENKQEVNCNKSINMDKETQTDGNNDQNEPMDDDVGDPDWILSDNESENPVQSQSANSTALIQETFQIESHAKNTVVKEKLFCDVENCGKVYYQMNALLIHKRRIHEGDLTPFHCDQCDHKFPTVASFHKHKNKGHGTESSESHLCSECGKTYAKASYLKYHARRVHKIENVPLKGCKFCGLGFGTEDELQLHENLHLNSDKPFTCLTCNEVLPNSSDLKSHMGSVHALLHLCDICGRQYRTAKSLSNHKKVHDESFQGYPCEHCGYVFNSKSALKAHMPVHTKENKYFCKDCGLGFKYRNTFQIHKRRHTGELPFACNFCDKRFITSHFLKHHESIHSGIMAYECKDCSKRFKSKTSLYQHEQRHKPDRVKKVRVRLRPKKVSSTNITGSISDHDHKVPPPKLESKRSRNTSSKISKRKISFKRSKRLANNNKEGKHFTSSEGESSEEVDVDEMEEKVKTDEMYEDDEDPDYKLPTKSHKSSLSNQNHYFYNTHHRSVTQRQELQSAVSSIQQEPVQSNGNQQLTYLSMPTLVYQQPVSHPYPGSSSTSSGGFEPKYTTDTSYYGHQFS